MLLQLNNIYQQLSSRKFTLSSVYGCTHWDHSFKSVRTEQNMLAKRRRVLTPDDRTLLSSQCMFVLASFKWTNPITYSPFTHSLWSIESENYPMDRCHWLLFGHKNRLIAHTWHFLGDFFCSSHTLPRHRKSINKRTTLPLPWPDVNWPLALVSIKAVTLIPPLSE